MVLSSLCLRRLVWGWTVRYTVLAPGRQSLSYQVTSRSAPAAMGHGAGLILICARQAGRNPAGPQLLLECGRTCSGGTAMTKAPLGAVLRHVRRAAARDTDEATDAELLRHFLGSRDPAAFEALVRRHGPMVLRVCRRVLGHHQDAEDAFQVTFLVLARKAPSIRRQASLAGWLHGVAYRTARCARRGAATRRVYEARVKTMTQNDAPHELGWREVQALLDEEIQALPEAYRAAFVLCQMEGHSREE